MMKRLWPKLSAGGPRRGRPWDDSKWRPLAAKPRSRCRSCNYPKGGHWPDCWHRRLRLWIRRYLLFGWLIDWWNSLWNDLEGCGCVLIVMLAVVVFCIICATIGIWSNAIAPAAR